MPASVIDSDWTVVAMNEACGRLAGLIMPRYLLRNPAGNLNMLDALVDPDGPLDAVDNLAESGPELLAHLRRDADANPRLVHRVAELAKRMAQTVAARPTVSRRPQAATSPPPVVVTRYRTDAGRLAFFSLFTTFGSPQDVTLESMRIEHLVPADDFTDETMRQLAQIRNAPAPATP